MTQASAIPKEMPPERVQALSAADANSNDGEHYQFACLPAMFAAAISNLIERFRDGDLIQLRFPTVGH